MNTHHLFLRVMALMCSATLVCPAAIAQTTNPPAGESYEIQPRDVPKRGNAEYFSTIPSQKLLMSVNIWGEVFQPGIHLIPVDSPLSSAISAAGGPTGVSNFPTATLIRQGKKQEIDLIEMGDQMKLRSQDTIYVARSIKSEMPLYFGAVSTIVSVLTLYYVTKKKD